jgi:hypothetical protein
MTSLSLLELEGDMVVGDGRIKKVSKKDEIHQKLIYWVYIQYNERDIEYKQGTISR